MPTQTDRPTVATDQKGEAIATKTEHCDVRIGERDVPTSEDVCKEIQQEHGRFPTAKKRKLWSR